MTERNQPAKSGSDLLEGLATDRLAKEAKSLLEAFAQRAMSSIGDKVTETTHSLIETLENKDDSSPGVKAAVSGIKAVSEGKSPVRAALGAGATGLKEKVKQAFGKGGKGGKRKLKFTNIVETIDVGVPLRLTYDQWTQYGDFPTFTKKVEAADAKYDDEKATSHWKAQVFWSHRTWEATIEEQVPDDHIVWRSKGPKGHVDGAVSFSELAPNLTRICLVLEYHPQGLFERTGNIWRAPGRRTRLEFKHFRRHVMSHAILHPDEIEGWRGEVREGEIVKTHEEAMEEEEERTREEESDQEPRDGEETSDGEETPDEGEDQDEQEDAKANGNGSARVRRDSESTNGAEPGEDENGQGRKSSSEDTDGEPARRRRRSSGDTNGEKPARRTRRPAEAANGEKPENGQGRSTRTKPRPEDETGRTRRRTAEDGDDGPAKPARRPRKTGDEAPRARRPKTGDQERPRTRRRPAAGGEERPRRRPSRRDRDDGEGEPE